MMFSHSEYTPAHRSPRGDGNHPTGESAWFSREPAHGLWSDKRASWPGDTPNFRDDLKHESRSHFPPHKELLTPIRSTASPPLTSRKTPASVLPKWRSEWGWGWNRQVSRRVPWQAEVLSPQSSHPTRPLLFPNPKQMCLTDHGLLGARTET